MKPNRRLFALFAIAFLFIVGNVPLTLKAQAAIQVTTTADVNLRSGPLPKANVLAIIPPGTTVPAIGRNQQTSWVQVKFDEKTGWVSVAFLSTSGNLKSLPVTDGQATPAPTSGGGPAPSVGVTGTVGASGISVRQSPSATSAKLGQLPARTVVALTGRQGSGNRLWVRFSFQGQDAWLAGWLLKITGDVNSLPAITPPSAAPAATPTPPPQTSKNQATLIFENQLATTLHIIAEGPTPIDVNIGPNSVLTFTVSPGNYVLRASAQGRVEVIHTVTLGAGQPFTWVLTG